MPERDEYGGATPVAGETGQQASTPPFTGTAGQRARLRSVKCLPARAAIIASVTGLLAACIGDSVPFGYKHIRYSDQYVPRSQLEEMVQLRTPRSEVIARLGSPVAENAQVRSIGYQRCITSDGYTVAVVILPLPVPSSHPQITSCQRLGLWFDADDRAVAWKEARHKVTEDSYGTRFTLAEWIENPEREPVP